MIRSVVWEFFMNVSTAAFAAAASSAGARALRQTRVLANEAPAGRLFASIATLIDAAGSAGAALTAGDMPRAARAIAALDIAGDALPMKKSA
jgi:hypothetical protein